MLYEVITGQHRLFHGADLRLGIPFDVDADRPHARIQGQSPPYLLGWRHGIDGQVRSVFGDKSGRAPRLGKGEDGPRTDCVITSYSIHYTKLYDNAILDGTDAVMLSAETASGQYPVQAVALMVRVAQDVEGDPSLKDQVYHPLDEVLGYRRLPEAIGQAACRVAETIGAGAILAFTQTGSTAALVAKYRLV